MRQPAGGTGPLRAAACSCKQYPPPRAEGRRPQRSHPLRPGARPHHHGPAQALPLVIQLHGISEEEVEGQEELQQRRCQEGGCRGCHIADKGDEREALQVREGKSHPSHARPQGSASRDRGCASRGGDPPKVLQLPGLEPCPGPWLTPVLPPVPLGTALHPDPMRGHPPPSPSSPHAPSPPGGCTPAPTPAGSPQNPSNPDGAQQGKSNVSKAAP